MGASEDRNDACFGTFLLHFYLEGCLAELGRAKARAGSSVPWGSKRFAHRAFRGVWSAGVGIGQISACCCSYGEAGDSYRPLSSNRDTDGSMLPALSWWLGWAGGGECNSSLHFPYKHCPRACPLTKGVTTDRGCFMKVIDSLKPASRSVQLICVSVNLGLVSTFYGPAIAVIIADRLPATAFT